MGINTNNINNNESVKQVIKQLEKSTMTEARNRLYAMMSNSSTMTDYANAIRTYVRIERNINGFNNHSIYQEFEPDEDMINKIQDEFTNRGYVLIGCSDYFSVFVKLTQGSSDIPCCYVNFDQNPSTYSVYGQGDQESLKGAEEIFKKYLSFKQVKADDIKEYFIEGDGIGTRELNIDFNNTNRGYDEFYPWLKEAGMTMEEFINDYLNSKEAILVLHGTAGTGKSTLINEILKRTKGHIGITSDTVLMAKGYNNIINRIRDSDLNMMIFEDADVLIGTTREQGNGAISSFLNIADGVGKSNSKEDKQIKIIFTTNLVSEKEIDEALIRAGRCYGVVTFDKLSVEDAQAVADIVNPEWQPDGRTSYSLAEVANQRANRVGNKQVVRRFKAGFSR